MTGARARCSPRAGTRGAPCTHTCVWCSNASPDPLRTLSRCGHGCAHVCTPCSCTHVLFSCFVWVREWMHHTLCTRVYMYTHCRGLLGSIQSCVVLLLSFLPPSLAPCRVGTAAFSPPFHPGHAFGRLCVPSAGWECLFPCRKDVCRMREQSGARLWGYSFVSRSRAAFPPAEGELPTSSSSRRLSVGERRDRGAVSCWLAGGRQQGGQCRMLHLLRVHPMLGRAGAWHQPCGTAQG